MSKETIWLIIAGVAALVAVPLIYLGLKNEASAMLMVGFGLFTLGMLVTPIMKIFTPSK